MSTLANVRVGSRAAVVAMLMVRPVCPQLRKCHVHPGSYAWCHLQTFSHQQAAGKCPLRVKTVVPAAAKRGAGSISRCPDPLSLMALGFPLSR